MTVESYWDAVDPYWEWFHDGVMGSTDLTVVFEQMPELGPLTAAHLCQSEIRNGGIYQLFYNGSGRIAPAGLEGFDLIGMPQTAQALRTAMERLGDPFPMARTARQKSSTAARKAAKAALAAKDESVDEWWSVYDDEEDLFYELIDTENGGFDAAATAYCNAAGLGPAPPA